MKAVDPIDVELCKSFREGPTFDSNLFELLIKYMYMEENQLARTTIICIGRNWLVIHANAPSVAWFV